MIWVLEMRLGIKIGDWVYDLALRLGIGAGDRGLKSRIWIGI